MALSGTNEPKIRIMIADGHALFREAIRAAMESEASFEVVALAGNVEDAIHQAETTKPEIAFLADGDLSDIDGIQATSRIKTKVPECRVIILAAEADHQGLVDALEAGADGYLTKDCALSELIHAAKAVNSGDVLIPGWMLGGLLARLMRRRKTQEDALRRVWELTRREREVLSLLAEGKDNEGIAGVLVISPQTARTHIQNILGKLGVHSRLEAAAFVAQNNVLEELTTNSQ